jgi:DNA invertase Pin-like site-specific DNA recombinase
MGDRQFEALMAELLLVVSANESRVLGTRISSGISAKKQRERTAFKWGFAANGTAEAASAAGNAAKQKNAVASAQRIVAAVEYLESNGVSQRSEQLIRLGEMGVTTARGKKVSRTTIHRAFKTLQAA